MRGDRDCQVIYGVFVKVETIVLLCPQETDITVAMIEARSAIGLLCAFVIFTDAQLLIPNVFHTSRNRGHCSIVRGRFQCST
jgi:hypothetical protein